jgi:hypothetical protein
MVVRFCFAAVSLRCSETFLSQFSQSRARCCAPGAACRTWLLCGVLVLLTSGTRADDAPPIDASIHTYVAESSRQIQAAAEQAFYEAAAARLNALAEAAPAQEASDFLAALAAAPPVVQQRVAQAMHRGVDDLRLSAAEAEFDAQDTAERARQTWAKTRSELAQRQAEWAALPPGPAPVAVGPPWQLDEWPLWWATFACVGLWAVAVAFVARHAARRHLAGGEWTAMAILLAAVVAGLVWVRPRAEGTAPNPTAANETADASPNVDAPALLAALRKEGVKADLRREESLRRYEDALATWRGRVDVLPEPAQRLFDKWLAAQDKLRATYVAAATIDALQQRTQADLGQQQTLEQQMSDRQAALAHAATRADRRRFAQAGVVLLVGAGLWSVLALALGWRRLGVGNTCVRCQNKGQFQVMAADTVDDPNEYELKCRGEWRGRIELPDGSFEEVKTECGFVTERRDQFAKKLVFPTIGDVSVGKTVWLSMCFDQIEVHSPDLPTGAELTVYRNDYVNQLRGHVHQIKTGEWQKVKRTLSDKLPHPLVLRCTDQDRPKRSQVAINIFDYGGEIASPEIAKGDWRYRLRKRMLRADGVFLFLDATATAESAQTQFNLLARFLEDAKSHHWKGRIGWEKRIPVAVCLSKLDDLLYNNELRRRLDPDAWTRFEEGAQALHRSHASRMQQIDGWSDLVAGLVANLWKQHSFTRDLTKYCGAKYRFFPIASLGLAWTRDRPFVRPFRVTEPLVWLLEVNGYRPYSLSERVAAPDVEAPSPRASLSYS